MPLRKLCSTPIMLLGAQLQAMIRYGPQAAVLGESIPKVEGLTDAQAIEQMEEPQAKYEEIVAGL